MRIKTRALAVSLALGAGTAYAQPAASPAPGPRLYSWSAGPGPGHTAVSLGGRLVGIPFYVPVLPIPTFELGVVAGVARPVDFEFRLSAAFVLNLAEVGVRVRLLDAGVASLYLRSGFYGMFPGITALGPTAGVGFHVGREHRFSFQFDMPWVVAGAYEVVRYLFLRGDPDNTWALLPRVQVTYEWPVGSRGACSCSSRWSFGPLRRTCRRGPACPRSRSATPSDRLCFRASNGTVPFGPGVR